MVLLIVVILVAMMSLAGLSFMADMSTEYKAARLHGAELQAQSVAASGVELVKSFIQQKPATRAQVGGDEDNPELFRGILVQDPDQGGPRARFSVISPKYENDELTGIRFGLENESSKLNLSVLPDWDRQAPGAGRNALMQLPGMTEAAADAILDWVDSDGSPRQFGAESDYYAGLNVPYGPRNAFPAALDELLLVKDVTRTLLYGLDRNRNFYLETTEEQSGEETGVTAGLTAAERNARPWASLLTVYSAERNLNPQGQPRIDLNDRDLRTLHQRLTQAIDREAADFIILYRQYGPDRGSGGKEKGSRERTTINFALAARYRIATALDLVGVRVRIPAEDSKVSRRGGDQGEEGNEKAENEEEPDTIVASPLDDEPRHMRDYLPRLLDAVTTDPVPILRGRINVNLAPRAVLMAVPGMDESTVQQILAAREARNRGDESDRRYPTWLVTEGAVRLDKMKELLPYLTCGGEVYRAQVVGFFDAGGPFARVDVVLDATVTPPRQVYYKDLRLLGRGYSLETLGAEPPGNQVQDSGPTTRSLESAGMEQ